MEPTEPALTASSDNAADAPREEAQPAQQQENAPAAVPAEPQGPLCAIANCKQPAPRKGAYCAKHLEQFEGPQQPAGNANANPAPASRPRGETKSKPAAPAKQPGKIESLDKASGIIGLAQEIPATFDRLKFKGDVKYMIMRLDEKALKAVELEAVGDGNTTFEDMLKALPPKDARFCAYRFNYVTKEDGNRQKIIFIHWSPERTPIKKKMAYAGARNFVFGLMEGFSIQVQACDPSELSEAIIFERCNRVSK